MSLHTSPGVAILSAFVLVSGAAAVFAADKPDIVRYARFQAGDEVSYGIVEGDRVRAIEGDLIGDRKPTDRTYPAADVKFLAPIERPGQVLALAGNYKSHLGAANSVTTVVTTTKTTTNVATGATTSDTRTTTDIEEPGKIPLKFQTPQLFFKSPNSIIGTGEAIVIPPGTNDVHYEAELVIVVGRRAKNVSESEALDYVLGVTAGNDVSARDWQKGDVQWWRAKGCDTFGPIGPTIVSGVNYDDLQLTLRLNGQVLQNERTSALIQNVPKIVSFVSRHVTLDPGDLIFTGTPGKTTAIKPGDTVEVELEGAGTLVNTVASAK